MVGSTDHAIAIVAGSKSLTWPSRLKYKSTIFESANERSERIKEVSDDELDDNKLSERIKEVSDDELDDNKLSTNSMTTMSLLDSQEVSHKKNLMTLSISSIVVVVETHTSLVDTRKPKTLAYIIFSEKMMTANNLFLE